MLALLLATTAQANPIVIRDLFDRDVTQRGITLLDWDGEIANPQVQLSVVLPADTAYPVDVYVHGTTDMIHFDRAEKEDRYGIGRRIKLNSAADSSKFKVSLFSSRVPDSREQRLWFQLFDAQKRELARNSIPVRQVHFMKQPGKARYPFITDFSYDQTGYFKSKDVQRVINLAIDDWAYFFDDQAIDRTPAGSEQMQNWRPDGFVQDFKIPNRRAYTGMMIFVSGIQHDEMRAGGAPSYYGQPQTSKGKPLPLRRSGTINFDIRGNWNQLGWYLMHGDHDWWATGSLRGEQSDLYSIAMHELGHAIGYNETFERFGAAKKTGKFDDPELVAYLGQAPPINSSEHFAGIVDPVSGYGMFGNEYEGTAKSRRWAITKANLLAMKAIGYKLRKTAAFDTFGAPPVSTWQIAKGVAFRNNLSASGGVPEYDFQVVEGSLPPGIALDRFTGALTGTPGESGQFTAKVQVRDQDPTAKPATTEVRITVQ